MKKLLGSTLALALFLPASANAELFKNLKLGGNLDVQMTSANNVTDFVTRARYAPGQNGAVLAGNHDAIGHASTRMMLKMDWDLLDDVHSRVTLVKGAQKQGGVAPKTSRPYGSGEQSVQTVQDQTFLQEAFVKVDKLFGFADMTLGRQFYGEPGDLIVYIGPRDDYGMTVEAVDMARFDWNGENLALTGIAGKTLDTNINSAAGGTEDIRGLVAALNKNETVKGSLYVYNKLTHAAGAVGNGNNVGGVRDDGKNTNLYVFGVKAKVNAGGLTASVEAAKNLGEDRTPFMNVNYKGYAFQAKAAYKADLQDVGAFTPWGEFGMGTGDAANTDATHVADGLNPAGNRTFSAINSDYRPGGIYGRFSRNSAIRLGNSAVISGDGLSNRVIYGFGFKATPAAINKLTMGVAFFKYNFHTRVQDSDGNANDQANSRSIGSEYDFTTEWKHSDNVGLKLTLGSFQPGKYIAQVAKLAGNGNNPATMAALDFSLKF